MARLLHQWKFDARHLTLVAIAVTAIATGIFIWLFVSPPAELQAQVLVGPSVSRVTPSGSKIFLETGDTQEFTTSATAGSRSISSWGWSLDGVLQGGQSLTPTESITRTFNHTFSTAGSYTVTGTFTDTEGNSSSVIWEVAVTAATPPSTDGCFQTLGGLTAGVSRNGVWNGDCASTHRSGSYARFYSFTLSEQAEVQIDLTSSEDTYLYLLRGADSGGTVLGENDDVVNGETDSRITETLAAGSYTVEATTYGAGVSGEFSLSVVPAGAATPPSTDGCFQTLGGLTAGVSRNGVWNGDCASTHRSGSYARFYSFTLSEQAEVQIDLTSSEDTYLYLLRGADSGGTVLGENDDVVNGETDSRITETLAAGSYTVEATTYGAGVSGEFSLSVVPAGAATPPSTDGCFQTLGGLTAGVSRNGVWNGDCASTHRSGSYARFYSFTLSEQAEVQIDLTSSEDTYLYLLRGADSGGDGARGKR